MPIERIGDLLVTVLDPVAKADRCTPPVSMAAQVIIAIGLA
jgi:hypothetical protein